MAAFRFRLARLMHVREIHEELARSELLAAEQALREAEGALERARGELHSAEAELAGVQARAEVVPGEVLAGLLTLPPLSRRVTLRRDQAAGRAAQADDARRAWQAARVDVRVLEKLEGRAREAHRELERAAEAKLIQEVVDRTGAAERASPEPGVQA